MWFDSHCHVDFPVFDRDRAAVLARAAALSVTELFVPGIEPRQWPMLPKLRQEYGFPFGVGHHPEYLLRQPSGALKESLSGLSASAEQLDAAAIGETGLDQRVAARGGASLLLQKEALVAHILCAKELALPLVLHVVQAHGVALELLQKYGPFAAGGVLHSYSGSAELVSRYASLNLSFGFGGAVTRLSARKVQRAATVVADEHLLLETDAPDQTPVGFAAASPQPAGLDSSEVNEPIGTVHPGRRATGSESENQSGGGGGGAQVSPGQGLTSRSRNEPASLILVTTRVAQLRGVSVEHVLRVSSANARQLFYGA